MRGNGFAFEVPAGWTVARPARGVAAHQGSGTLSVLRFPLAKPYDPSQFDIAAKALDRVAARLSATAKGETVEVDGRKARAYTYGSRKIGFVLAGSTEYQLFCDRAGSACDLLFSSFALTGPQA